MKSADSHDQTARRLRKHIRELTNLIWWLICLVTWLLTQSLVKDRKIRRLTAKLTDTRREDALDREEREQFRELLIWARNQGYWA